LESRCIAFQKATGENPEEIGISGKYFLFIKYVRPGLHHHPLSAFYKDPGTLLYFRELMLEGCTKRRRDRRKSRYPARVDPVGHDAVNTVAPLVKAIVT
jgi:hypothetical protein